MADNIPITVGDGSAIQRSHNVSGDIHVPIVKVAFGSSAGTTDILNKGRQAPADSAPCVTPLETAAFLTVAERLATNISGSFQAVGTFAAGTRIGKFVNTTPVNLIFSCDGSNSHITVFPRSKDTIDFGANGLITAVSVTVKHDGTAPGAGNGAARIEGVSI